MSYTVVFLEAFISYQTVVEDSQMDNNLEEDLICLIALDAIFAESA